MENLPTKDDFRDEYPNVGYNRDAYQKALEKWAKDAVFKIMTLEENIHDRIKFYEQNVIEIREAIDKREQYSAEWEHDIDSLKFVKEKIRLLNYLLSTSSNCA